MAKPHEKIRDIHDKLVEAHELMNDAADLIDDAKYQAPDKDIDETPLTEAEENQAVRALRDVKADLRQLDAKAQNHLKFFVTENDRFDIQYGNT